MIASEKSMFPSNRSRVFLATAVRELYADLSNVKRDDPNLVKALTFEKVSLPFLIICFL